ncbi:hypothetical protein GGE50_003465 [Rhizobium leguminosarum]|nr:hypothetical protein [Rhizobium leguminosarum]MBB4587564.1 hypothetical protein [Rhizobium leguminosarum]
MLPRGFRFDARDEHFVIDEGFEEVVSFVSGAGSMGEHLSESLSREEFKGPCKPQRGVNKARRHPLEQANDFVDMAKQKRAGIRGDRAAIETSHNFVAVEASKFELRGDTV